jgi:long-chain acyl-CoA synthetase
MTTTMTSTDLKSVEESPYALKPWLQHYDFWVPEHARYPERNVYHILTIAATHYPERPATAFHGAQMTYSELRSQADAFAAALVRLGVGKGDRVGIMLPNCPQYLVAFFGIVRLGAIVTNINPIYTEREISIVAQDSGLKALITLDLLAPAALNVASGNSIESIIVTSLAEYFSGNAPRPSVAGTVSLGDLLEESRKKPVDLPRVDIDAKEDVAVLQYTGGTTGTPKGAMLTHFNLYANTIQTALWSEYFTERGNERYLLVIPYFHIYGQTVGMLVGAWQGAMQILIPKFDADMMVEAFNQYHPTFFPGVPTLYISLLNHPKIRECGLDLVRRFNSGSAPLPVEVISAFETITGQTLTEGYGLTETSPVTHSTPFLAKRKPGSIGLPLTSTECRIVDIESGEREVGVGEDGELCIRGPQVMKGYWRKPEETAHAIRNGWFYTGDVARMDEDGFFYIVQRKKDMIIVSGFNVYPNEVEEVLFTHPAVREASVIGVPDKYRGEAVKAFIVLKDGATASSEDLCDYCRERLAKFKLPSLIEFLPALPKSAVGKVLRRSLREMEAQSTKE